jgi:hypothetical protein
VRRPKSLTYRGNRVVIELPRAGGTHGDIAQALAVGVGMFATDMVDVPEAAPTIVPRDFGSGSSLFGSAFGG